MGPTVYVGTLNTTVSNPKGVETGHAAWAVGLLLLVLLLRCGVVFSPLFGLSGLVGALLVRERCVHVIMPETEAVVVRTGVKPGTSSGVVVSARRILVSALRARWTRVAGLSRVDTPLTDPAVFGSMSRLTGVAQHAVARTNAGCGGGVWMAPFTWWFSKFWGLLRAPP
jgi:hypothetical protein